MLLGSVQLTPALTTDFAALLDEAWEWQLEQNPMMASALGDRRYNDQWGDQSLQAAGSANQQTNARFLRRLFAIDRGSLSEADQLNYELFRRELQSEIDAFSFKGHLLPFSHMGGIQNLEETTNAVAACNSQGLRRLAGADGQHRCRHRADDRGRRGGPQGGLCCA